MTVLTVTAHAEILKLANHFTIARGDKSEVEVVVCAVSDGTHTGRAEATPVYYEGETAELCIDAINMRAKSRVPLTRESLLETMMEGAARNALDCALWDLECRQAGKQLWEMAKLPAPKPLVTALTISLDTPAAMGKTAGAAAAHGFKLLKLKLNGEDDLARVKAVRAAAPDVQLIIDLNEAWDELDIEEEVARLAPCNIALIEQPIAAGNEDLLDGLRLPIPLAADESCLTHEDLGRCEGRFQVINIKLDKAGGLTEALLLAEKARMRGFDIMVGCMLGSSLGIRPAFALAQNAKWVDLDAPLWLKADRVDGLPCADGMLG
ncbi:MAG: dipeptide epimerase [Alphaproteobacteria bacterium]|nr:dipeptide epimerase [Alphaproteobacteria bacterium]MDE2340593.1 dipeptide epimerase [Alphaproteobacteria bacterium]